MHLPVMTGQLARRIQHVLACDSVAGMTYLQQQAGNPLGVQIQQFGSATAYLAPVAGHIGWWNRVKDLQEPDIVYLDAILAFYRAHHVRFFIDMEPASFSEEISKALVARGLYPTINGTVLYGLPRRERGLLPAGLSIYESQPGEIDLFMQLWADGFEFSANDDRNTIMAIRRAMFSAPGNRRYIAAVDDTPAAMAGLYMRDGLAYLSGAATLPAFRNRGCHSALTRRRLNDAARAGCELVVGHTGAFGSISQHNMERAGLHTAYQMITWAGDAGPRASSP